MLVTSTWGLPVSIFFVVWVPKDAVSSPCTGTGKGQLVLHSSHWQGGEQTLCLLLAVLGAEGVVQGYPGLGAEQLSLN